jgi:tRNA(fMet)-specific endonuclease VapC
MVFEQSAAEQYGLLKAALSKAGQLISDNDIQIASIAVANDLKLVTHNTAHFNRLIPYGLQLDDLEY